MKDNKLKNSDVLFLLTEGFVRIELNSSKFRKFVFWRQLVSSKY